MLFPEQVKPLLSSSDPEIRQHALEYFAKARHDDPDLIPLFLAAWEQDTGTEVYGSGLYLLRHLTVSDDGLKTLVDAYEFTEPKDQWHLTAAILSAPPQLYESLDMEPFSSADGGPEFARRIERRKEFARCTAEDLWDELQGYLREDTDGLYANQLDHGLLDDLFDVLADRDFPDESILLDHISCISADKDYDWTWIDLFAIVMAGRRRLTAAVPLLVKLFHIDTDWTLERASEALAWIGDPQTIPVIRDQWQGSEWNFRNFMSSVPPRILCQESEDLLLELAETEQDAVALANLGMGLAQLLSEPGIDVIARLIREGRYDPWVADLVEDAVLTCRALDIDHPDAAQWAAHQEEERRRAEERKKMWDLPHPVRKPHSPFELAPQPRQAVAHTAATETTAAVGTIRNTAPKVGRNKPCPCGSGKKYKKCCG